MISNLSAIALGAVLGAWLRYFFGLAFNPLFPTIPLGTLAANLTGGLLIGLMIGFSHDHSYFSETFRLAFITGFLGALTTFSTFSGEVSLLFLRQQWGCACITCLAHVGGSIFLTLSGIFASTTLVRTFIRA